MKDIGIAQLKAAPNLQVGETIRTNRYEVLRQMGNSSKVITGIHKLAQFVTKILLTTQGSDKYDLTYGSSLLFLLRDSKSLSELEDLKGQIALHMKDVRRQVIIAQTNANLPADERLRDLQLTRAEFLTDQLKFEIDLKLISEAGTERVLNLADVLASEE